MTRFAFPSILSAIVVIGLAVVAIILGLNLLPTRVEAIEKGTYAPWLIVWAMIAIVEVCSIALAGFLFMYGLKGMSART
jgi:uncharacterized membrane protein YidH (DUF202 family)